MFLKKIYKEKKWRKKKKKCTLWQYEDSNMFVVLFKQLSFIMLYNGLYVKLLCFVFYLCCTLIYICCYNSYSLMRKIQFCTLLSVLCTRLIDSMLNPYLTRCYWYFLQKLLKLFLNELFKTFFKIWYHYVCKRTSLKYSPILFCFENVRFFMTGPLIRLNEWVMWTIRTAAVSD